MTVPRAYLTIVGLAVVAYYFLPPDSQGTVNGVIGLSAAAAMFIGIRWHRPQPPSAWVLLACGVLLLAAGDVAYGAGQPVPSPADMLYISAYPLLALGIAGLAPWNVARRPGVAVAVGACVAAAVGAVSWFFLIVPSGDTEGVTFSTRVVALGYPVMDAALLALLARAAAPERFGRAHHRLLGVALLCTLVADAGWALQDFGTGYSIGGLLDALWLVQYACFGGALLEPSLRTRFHATTDVARRGLLAHASATTVTIAMPVSVLRFEVVAMWAGRLLLGLAGVTLVLSARWLTGDVLMLAGAYGITGCLMLVAGAARAWSS